MIKELKPIRYIDYNIYNITKIKNKFGFRVVLTLDTNEKRIVQHSGFDKKEIAEKERCKIIGQLENRTYIIYTNITISEYMEYWYENLAPKRLNSYGSFMAYRNAIFNYIIPSIGKIKLVQLTSGIIEQMYKSVYSKSKGVARIVQTAMSTSLEDAKVNMYIPTNEAKNVKLPKSIEEKIKEATTEKTDIAYHTKVIDERKTFTIEQIATIIKESKNTPIYLHVLFATLMGLRKSEINGIKYSDIDFIRRKLYLGRQLGRRINDKKDDCPAKCLTEQENPLKTKSSYRTLDIPDLLFDAILEERNLYERRRNRRINDKHNPFRDWEFICCSTYGKPRSRGFVFNYFEKIKTDNNLPNLPWHKLRTTYTTILAKNNFSLKAISVLLGHSSEIITFENYTDKNEIINDCLQDLEPFISSMFDNNAEDNIVDCTDIEINIIMQDYFNNIMIA